MEKKTPRHAYLIMAHDQFDQLACLLRLLDDERNDIYVHIDKKAGAVNTTPLDQAVNRAKLYLVKRLRVDWGSYSQVACELMLLETAHRQGPYEYYHLLSGADLPLKTQDEIHQFFGRHQGKEFVNFEAPVLTEERLSRIRYWHLFRGSKNWGLKLISRGLWELQKLLRADRLRGCTWKLQKGANWFSITEGLVGFIVEHRRGWEHLLRCSRYADELLVQTALINSPYEKNRYSAEYDASGGNLRKIDWVRGAPYTWRKGDLKELRSSECLFARKFSMELDAEVVQAVAAMVQAGGNDGDEQGEDQCSCSNL